MSRFRRLSLVAIVLLNTLQVVNCVEGRVFSFHNSPKSSPYTTDSSLKRKLYAAFTENSLNSTSLQSHLSVIPSPSFNNLLLSNICNNCSVWLDSHIKRSLLHSIFHNHLLFLQTPTCDRVRPISRPITI